MFRLCLSFPPTHLLSTRLAPDLDAGRAGTDVAPTGWAERAWTCPTPAAQAPYMLPPCSPSSQRKRGTYPKPSPPGGNPGPPGPPSL